MISAMVKFLILLFLNESFVLQYDLVGERDRRGDREPKRRATDIIARLDVGGDRKLSKQEFIAGYILLNYLSLSTYFSSFTRCKNDPVIRRILAPNA